MTILFVTRHFGCLRSYERAIIQLAARGHRVRLAALRDDALGGRAMVERWVATHPALSVARLPDEVDTPWTTLTERLRLMVDYLRYLDPTYRHASRLIERAVERTPRIILTPGATRVMGSRVVRRVVAHLLRRLESAVPGPPEIESFLRSERPDVVLLTPLIGLGSRELDYLNAAKALGQRTIFCVWSWDNLSSKALIRTIPDRVTVWNEVQRREAIELHDVPAERVVVTGAQSFDEWFERRPTGDRSLFCARAGLPAGPFLLWVCSALIRGSPPEAPFVRRWIEWIRDSGDPVLGAMPILVRPHPSRVREWESVDLSDLGPVSLWGANPVDLDARRDYFESLHFATAIAGLNTSAFLEGAIQGRPVFSILLPEFQENQEGTLHFHYLLGDDGLLRIARDAATHLAQLGEAVRTPDQPDERSQRFVARFIRPRGADTPATDVFVEAVEATAAMGPGRPLGWSLSASLLRLPLRFLAARVERPWLAERLRSPRDQVKHERWQRHVDARAERREQWEAKRAEEHRRKEQAKEQRFRLKREREGQARGG